MSFVCRFFILYSHAFCWRHCDVRTTTVVGTKMNTDSDAVCAIWRPTDGAWVSPRPCRYLTDAAKSAAVATATAESSQYVVVIVDQSLRRVKKTMSPFEHIHRVITIFSIVPRLRDTFILLTYGVDQNRNFRNRQTDKDHTRRKMALVRIERVVYTHARENVEQAWLLAWGTGSFSEPYVYCRW